MKTKGLKCCIPRCKSRQGKSPNEVTFHKFPSDELLRQSWILSIKGESWWCPTKHTTICSLHFRERDIFNSKGLTQIRAGALPKRKIKNKFVSETLPVWKITQNHRYFRSRKKWTDYEKEIIEFVRQNPIIYDPDIGIQDDMQRQKLIKDAWQQFILERGSARTTEKLQEKWNYIISDYYSDKYKTKKFFDGRLSFLPKISTIAHSPEAVLIDDVEKEIFSNDKIKETVSMCSNEIPNYAFNKSLFPQNDTSVDVSRKIEFEPNISDSGKGNKTNKPKFDRETLLQATVLTQDMIEELLRIKSNEEDTYNILEVSKNNKIFDDINKQESTKNSSTNASTSKIPSSSSVFNVIADTINIDDQIMNIPIKKTINFKDNEKNINKLNHEKVVQDYIDYQNNTTIKSFVQMGEHILIHFSENEHEEVRTMIASLIAKEESALID